MFTFFIKLYSTRSADTNERKYLGSVGHVITSGAGYPHSSLWDSSCLAGTSCWVPVLLIWNQPQPDFPLCSSRYSPLIQKYFPRKQGAEEKKTHHRNPASLFCKTLPIGVFLKPEQMHSLNYCRLITNRSVIE